jgi:hypothetical protein
MAFQFNSDSQGQATKTVVPRRGVGMFSICIIGSFILLLGVVLAWSPLSSAAKTAWGRQYAKEARSAISGNDLSAAVPKIIAARRWAPEDVEVIRVVVEYLKTTNSDPSSLSQQLKLLATKQALTTDEEVLLGKSLIATRKTAEARALYEKMASSGGASSAKLNLLSSLLYAEGHDAEAAEVSLRSVLQQSGSAAARLQRAIEDRDHFFPEIQRWARLELWDIANLDSDVGLQALVQLSNDPDLTTTEARQLLKLVDQHPHQNLTSHLSVVSALMRLQPEQRETLLDAEIARFKAGEKEGKLAEFATWLAVEKQYARLRKLLPSDLAIKSRELYPILADALVAEGRWQELRTMLTTHRPPSSAALAGVWLAEVESHLQPDLKETRWLLLSSIELATRDGNPAALFAAGVLAEKLSLGEIAVQAYQAAAINDSESSVKLLQKAFEMAQVQKNPVALLAISRRLHELRPSSAVFSERFDYLRLILGAEMENVNLAQSRHADGKEVVLDHIPVEFLRALAAYRLGDNQGMAANLRDLTETARLTPGQRAVIAGLLALSGSNARAFQIAERVPEKLLLDEERQFLQRAK